MTPPVESLVSHYGLAAVGMGTLLEGETVLLAAAALASRGVLNPAAVWGVAACGAWLGHAIWFGVGRGLGSQRITALFPQWSRALDTADQLIRRRPWTCIFSLQYLYGMRLPGAVALGLSSLPTGSFMAAEAVNCATWAALVGALGYLGGESVAAVLQQSGRLVWVCASGVVVAGVVYGILRRMKRESQRR
jgi:membrane-associated protein